MKNYNRIVGEIHSVGARPFTPVMSRKGRKFKAKRDEALKIAAKLLEMAKRDHSYLPAAENALRVARNAKK